MSGCQQSLRRCGICRDGSEGSRQWDEGVSCKKSRSRRESVIRGGQFVMRDW